MKTNLIELIEQLNQQLPQTQCTKCGYPDCLSYATAMAEQKVPHNQCPPGGQTGIHKLAEILYPTPNTSKKLTLNPKNGVEAPKKIAWIVEEDCIGCTKCIQACPVDAIVGIGKMMHTVIAADCTGCELCISPCPVDCIKVKDDSDPILHSQHYQTLYKQHKLRQKQKPATTSIKTTLTNHSNNSDNLKKDYIAQALIQFRNKKNNLKKS